MTTVAKLGQVTHVLVVFRIWLQSLSQKVVGIIQVWITTVAKLGQLTHVLVFLIWSQSKGCRNHPSMNDHCSQNGSAHTCVSSIPYMVTVSQPKGCSRNHRSVNDHCSQTGSAYACISIIPYMVAVSHLSVKKVSHHTLVFVMNNDQGNSWKGGTM